MKTQIQSLGDSNQVSSAAIILIVNFAWVFKVHGETFNIHTEVLRKGVPGTNLKIALQEEPAQRLDMRRTAPWLQNKVGELEAY